MVMQPSLLCNFRIYFHHCRKNPCSHPQSLSILICPHFLATISSKISCFFLGFSFYFLLTMKVHWLYEYFGVLYFFMVLWFELMASHLLGRHSTTAVYLQPFFFNYFGGLWFLLSISLRLQSSYLYQYCNLVTGTYHHAWLSNLLPGCSQSMIFPISAFKVAGTIGMSHHAWLYFVFII
jgi:hypothetical protein